MNILLSEEELVMLTDYALPKYQRKELARLGIPFQPGRTGRPKVLREAVITRLGGRAKKEAQVNITALDTYNGTASKK